MVLKLAPMDNPLSRRVARFVGALRRGRFVFPEVRVCVRTQPAAAQFMAMLVEDKTRGDMSYVDGLDPNPHDTNYWSRGGGGGGWLGGVDTQSTKTVPRKAARLSATGRSSRNTSNRAQQQPQSALAHSASPHGGSGETLQQWFGESAHRLRREHLRRRVHARNGRRPELEEATQIGPRKRRRHVQGPKRLLASSVVACGGQNSRKLRKLACASADATFKAPERLLASSQSLLWSLASGL
jgi:hypothetical protein